MVTMSGSEGIVCELSSQYIFHESALVMKMAYSNKYQHSNLVMRVCEWCNGQRLRIKNGRKLILNYNRVPNTLRKDMNLYIPNYGLNSSNCIRKNHCNSKKKTVNAKNKRKCSHDPHVSDLNDSQSKKQISKNNRT